jgi:hypothetical protein
MTRHVLLAVVLTITAQASAADPGGRTPAEIDRLVKQLGSVRFEEREAASKALEKVGYPALGALRKAAKSQDRETRRRARLLVEQIENGLDALLASYKEYGLPLPPKDAQLVRVAAHRVILFPRKEFITRYALGFRLPPGAAPAPPRVLVGTEVYEPDPVWQPPEAVRPDAADLKGISPRWHGGAFPLNAGLATAIQCHALGHTRLARRLLAHSLTQEGDLSPSLFQHPDDRTPRADLAYLAWTHWANEIVRPGTDRAAIARRMKALLAAEPALDTEGCRGLLKSLELTLRPSRARPGSVEALLDGLLDLAGGGVARAGPESAYWRLVERGFDAVPALIDHLDDERLTRCVLEGAAALGVPGRHVRVRGVAGDILCGLAAGDLDRGWLRQQDAAVQKAAARAWWAKARKQGEEKYLLAHVLPAGPEAQDPNDHLLWVIARRYPRRLVGVYRTVLEGRPDVQSGPVAEAVSNSTLPREEKIELLRRAARHANPEHRRVALLVGRGLDPKAFADTAEMLPVPKEGP